MKFLPVFLCTVLSGPPWPGPGSPGPTPPANTSNCRATTNSSPATSTRPSTRAPRPGARRPSSPSATSTSTNGSTTGTSSPRGPAAIHPPPRRVLRLQSDLLHRRLRKTPREGRCLALPQGASGPPPLHSPRRRRKTRPPSPRDRLDRRRRGRLRDRVPHDAVLALRPDVVVDFTSTLTPKVAS